ncbi:hypothetical protein Tco_0124111, partial [Tanacetum coccineum]
TDVVSYTKRFQELALMYGRMFPKESDEVEKYFGGLPDMIQGTENKRKLDDNSRNNQTQQQPYKRQNVATAYTARPDATTARKLAIWPVPVEVQLLLLTTREPPRRFRGLSLALSVECRGITRRIALN